MLNTPPKFSIAPEDDPFLLGFGLFSGAILNFRGVSLLEFTHRFFSSWREWTDSKPWHFPLDRPPQQGRVFRLRIWKSPRLYPMQSLGRSSAISWHINQGQIPYIWCWSLSVDPWGYGCLYLYNHILTHKLNEKKSIVRGLKPLPRYVVGNGGKVYLVPRRERFRATFRYTNCTCQVKSTPGLIAIHPKSSFHISHQPGIETLINPGFWNLMVPHIFKPDKTTWIWKVFEHLWISKCPPCN